MNLKKQTLRLVKVPNNPHLYTLEFTFDAAAACTLSVWYLAEEKTDVTNNTLCFETQYPTQPQTVQFEKGLAQQYLQPVEDGFNYRSDNNDLWLDVEAMRALLEDK